MKWPVDGVAGREAASYAIPPVPSVRRASAYLRDSFCARNDLASVRNSRRVPPLYALRLTRALPLGVLGPVDLSHGIHVRICSDCLLRRSRVQLLAIARLQ